VGNCREWYYEELDAPVPFPGYENDLELTEPAFNDAGINEAVAVESTNKVVHDKAVPDSR